MRLIDDQDWVRRNVIQNVLDVQKVSSIEKVYFVENFFRSLKSLTLYHPSALCSNSKGKKGINFELTIFGQIIF